MAVPSGLFRLIVRVGWRRDNAVAVPLPVTEDHEADPEAAKQVAGDHVARVMNPEIDTARPHHHEPGNRQQRHCAAYDARRDMSP